MFVIIGQYHSSLSSALEHRGITYATIRDRKRYDDTNAIAFDDFTTVVNAITSLSEPPTVIMAMYEQYIPITAQLNEYFGLKKALTYDSALAATDKVAMRNAFLKLGDMSPQFQEVETTDESIAFAASVGYPLIIKPANLSKSMLIKRCDSDDDIRDFFNEIHITAPTLYKKYTNNQSPKFLIEQFMVGSLHTVAAFANANGDIFIAPGVVDNVSSRDHGYDDEFVIQRTLPSMLPQDIQTQLLHCADSSARALNLRSCPAHIEILLTSSGPRIIEIGARLGGYRPLMYDYSYNHDLLDAAIQSYQGRKPSFHASPAKKSTTVIELFPHAVGTLIDITGVSRIKNLESFKNIRLQKKPGDRVGLASDGFKAIGYVVLSHEDPNRLENDAARVLESFTCDVS